MGVTRFPLGHIRERERQEIASRLDAERLSAPSLVDEALRRTPRDQWHTLAQRPNLATIGVIEHLEKLLDAEMTREPKRAEALARLALTLSEALPPHTYPAITLAQTNARSWKNVGKVLSYLARHDDANEAFTRAIRCLEPYFALAHDRAIVHLNLAINYLESDRTSEALELLASCKEIFHDHADAGRFVLASFYEGRVQQHLRHYREAREIYLLLLASSSDIPKPTLAAIHHSIGICSMELKDYRAAEDNFRKTIALTQELGQTLDTAKGEHGRAILLIRQGYPSHGLTTLSRVRHQYLKHSLAEEAGICGVDMVGAMLMLGNFEKAEHLARTIISEFLAAGLNTRALTALGYLTEAIASQEASPKLANHVREYVLSLRTNPEREFTQLPPTDAG